MSRRDPTTLIIKCTAYFMMSKLASFRNQKESEPQIAMRLEMANALQSHVIK